MRGEHVTLALPYFISETRRFIGLLEKANYFVISEILPYDRHHDLQKARTKFSNSHSIFDRCNLLVLNKHLLF